MPKIALIIDVMCVGGIQKTGITFMNRLLKYADVTLIQTTDKEALCCEIPKGVHVHTIPKKIAPQIFKEYISRKKFVQGIFFRLYSLFLSHFQKRYVVNNAYCAKKNSYILDEEFDCAVSYHGMSIDHLSRTLYSVKSKKKIAWIHGDHSFGGKHIKDAEKIYKNFDKIYCVSGVTEERFLKDFPSLKDKTEVFYNFFDEDRIKKLSEEKSDFVFDNNKITLATVGRISPEKGQDMMPEIAKILIDKGYPIRWYVVGDGDDRERVENIVKEKKLFDFFIFTLSKSNPYPYIKNCDIYVQPSYTEGYPLTIFEAAILGKAIVATDVGGTKEHLTKDKDILLTDVSPEAIAESIELLINNPDKKKMLENSLSGRDFSNSKEMDKLLKFINED